MAYYNGRPVKINATLSSGGGSGEISEDFIAELQTILNAVSFYDNDVSAHIIHLSEYAGGGGGGGTRFTITKNLTGVTISNTASDIAAGLTFAATLAAETEGFEPSNVSITMGGVDITSTAYNDKIINIENVSGDIVITATEAMAGLIYALSTPITNTSDEVNGSYAVDTGVKLFAADEDKTIFAEAEFFDTLTKRSSPNDNALFSNIWAGSVNGHNAFYARYNGDTTSLTMLQRDNNGTNKQTAMFADCVGKTVRLAIVYKAAERKMYYYAVKMDDTTNIIEKTEDISGTTFTADESNFVIGGCVYGYNYGSIRSTSINECEIYNAAFSREIVVDWFNH